MLSELPGGHVNTPVGPDASPSRNPIVRALKISAVLALPLALLVGCPGTLEGNFPPPGAGSGGSGTGGSGSGGSGSGSGGSSAACDAPNMVFKNRCSGSVCHNNMVIAPDLFTAPVENALIGKVAVFSIAGCASGSSNLVNPAKPVDGVLLKRLMGTDCGAQMPMAPAAALMPSEIQCVTDWLASKLP
jgi:hypothetical protein